MPFAINVEHGDGHVVVSPSGDVDLDTAAELRDVCRAVVGEDPTLIVLDLSAVTFMDSTGLSVLVLLRREAEARESLLRLVSGRRTNAILRISGLSSVFDIHPSLRDALGPSDESA